MTGLSTAGWLTPLTFIPIVAVGLFAARPPRAGVVLARNGNALTTLRSDPRWKPITQTSGLPVWTDQFSNILSVAKSLNSLQKRLETASVWKSRVRTE